MEDYVKLPIKTKNGTLEVLVDSDSGADVTGHTWLLSSLGHPYRLIKTDDGPKVVHLPRVVMGVTSKRVKFVSSNKLDCRKANLVIGKSVPEEVGTAKLALEEVKAEELVVEQPEEQIIELPKIIVRDQPIVPEPVDDIRPATTRMPFTSHQEESTRQKHEFILRTGGGREVRLRQNAQQAKVVPIDQQIKGVPLELLIRELKVRGATNIIF